MREIKFRGKRTDNGEWVYGCLTRYSEEISIITVDFVKNEVFEVHTKTIGQYTNLSDKRSCEIYSGDIVLQYEGKEYSQCYLIDWNMFHCGYWLCTKDEPHLPFGGYREDILVVGNIHDNPEIL